jgi:hypothetical protein
MDARVKPGHDEVKSADFLCVPNKLAQAQAALDRRVKPGDDVGRVF